MLLMKLIPRVLDTDLNRDSKAVFTSMFIYLKTDRVPDLSHDRHQQHPMDPNDL